MQVNDQSGQIVDLHAATETCDVAPLNFGTQIKRAIARRLVLRDIGKQFVAITAKVEKAPVEVDGAIIRRHSGAYALAHAPATWLIAAALVLHILIFNN